MGSFFNPAQKRRAHDVIAHLRTDANRETTVLENAEEEALFGAWQYRISGYVVGALMANRYAEGPLVVDGSQLDILDLAKQNWERVSELKLPDLNPQLTHFSTSPDRDIALTPMDRSAIPKEVGWSDLRRLGFVANAVGGTMLKEVISPVGRKTIMATVIKHSIFKTGDLARLDVQQQMLQCLIDGEKAMDTEDMFAPRPKVIPLDISENGEGVCALWPPEGIFPITRRGELRRALGLIAKGLNNTAGRGVSSFEITNAPLAPNHPQAQTTIIPNPQFPFAEEWYGDLRRTSEQVSAFSLAIESWDDRLIKSTKAALRDGRDELSSRASMRSFGSTPGQIVLRHFDDHALTKGVYSELDKRLQAGILQGKTALDLLSSSIQDAF